MSSCSHFNDFLSNDQVGKQSAKSKRGQEATSNEGSPMAKPRPAIPVVARPINLVMRSPRSEQDSLQSLGSLVNPENADERKEVEIAAGNSWQFASRSEVGYSQASRQENAPMTPGNSWREEQLQEQCDEREYSNSNCTRASKPEFQNMAFTNNRTVHTRTGSFSSCKRSWES